METTLLPVSAAPWLLVATVFVVFLIMGLWKQDQNLKNAQDLLKKAEEEIRRVRRMGEHMPRKARRIHVTRVVADAVGDALDERAELGVISYQEAEFWKRVIGSNCALGDLLPQKIVPPPLKPFEQAELKEEIQERRNARKERILEGKEAAVIPFPDRAGKIRTASKGARGFISALKMA